jgi:hypothetical protein
MTPGVIYQAASKLPTQTGAVRL